MSSLIIKSIFICLFLLITYIKANEENKCPTVQALEKFNMAELPKSKWFELARYENIYEKPTKCARLTHSMEETKCKIKYTDMPENSTDYAEAYLHHKSGTEGSGYLMITLSYPNLEKSQTVSVPLYVVGYEKNQFMISYACNDDKNIKKELAWILTTSPNPSQAVRNKIKEALNDKYIFDTEKFLWLDNTDNTCIGQI